MIILWHFLHGVFRVTGIITWLWDLLTGAAEELGGSAEEIALGRIVLIFLPGDSLASILTSTVSASSSFFSLMAAFLLVAPPTRHGYSCFTPPAFILGIRSLGSISTVMLSTLTSFLYMGTLLPGEIFTMLPVLVTLIPVSSSPPSLFSF